MKPALSYNELGSRRDMKVAGDRLGMITSSGPTVITTLGPTPDRLVGL